MQTRGTWYAVASSSGNVCTTVAGIVLSLSADRCAATADAALSPSLPRAHYTP